MTGSKLKLLLRQVDQDLSSLQQRLVRVQPAANSCPDTVLPTILQTNLKAACYKNRPHVYSWLAFASIAALSSAKQRKIFQRAEAEPELKLSDGER